MFVSTRYESASVREDRTPTSFRIRSIVLVVILVVLIGIYMAFIPIVVVHRMYGAHTVRVIAAADAAQIIRSTAVQWREPTVVCDSTLLVVLVLGGLLIA
jgi:disulfide bond formation protein DsbB